MPKDSATPVLEVRSLVKRFPIRVSTLHKGSLTAVSDISFSIDGGETLGLVGESGCGKSTIGKCILNLHKADHGQILFRGQNVGGLREARFRAFRRGMQIVFQNPRTSFDKMRSVGSSIQETLSLRNLSPKEKKQRSLALFEEVGLGQELVTRYPFQLSGGQLQRVAVARALAPEPDFIFLDEPTASLDMSVKGQVVNVLLDIQQDRGTSYLLVSHDLRVVAKMSDRVMVMYLGEIVEEGCSDELFTEPVHPYTRTLLAATRLGKTDGDESNEDSLIRGEVVRILDGETGCKLSNRCVLAEERCRTEAPRTVEVSEGHFVRCWRLSGSSRVTEPER